MPLLNPARAHFTDALSFEAPAAARAGIQEVQPIHGERKVPLVSIGVNQNTSPLHLDGQCSSYRGVPLDPDPTSIEGRPMLPSPGSGASSAFSRRRRRTPQAHSDYIRD